MAIDFRREVSDESLLDEIRLIQEESEKINEHGLGSSTLLALRLPCLVCNFLRRIRHPWCSHANAPVITCFVLFQIIDLFNATPCFHCHHQVGNSVTGRRSVPNDGCCSPIERNGSSRPEKKNSAISRREEEMHDDETLQKITVSVCIRNRRHGLD